MLHENTLHGTTAGTLENLGRSGILAGAYLAGGTAAALQLGHRISYDLDFFIEQPFDEKRLKEQLKKLGFRQEREEWQTVIGMIDGIQFSYFTYRYPLLRETIPYHGIAVANLQDIAAMKIDAIGTRGIRRDFIDLFAIMCHQSLSLKDCMDLYQKKYSTRRDTLVHLIKSLTYFDDAEIDQDRPLVLLVPIDWETVKAFFRNAVEKTGRELLED